MTEESRSSIVETQEQLVSALATKLAHAKAVVQTWTEASSDLSRSAAEVRAKNQGAGRGFFGALLGAKYRGVVRSAAAASNASVAKEVATRKTQLVEGKRRAQELVREVQAQLAEAKQELKALTSTTKSKSQVKVAVAKAASESLDLLQKLKQARDAGLLTEEEYEEKRARLVSEL